MIIKIHLLGTPLCQILPRLPEFLQCSSKKKAVYLQALLKMIKNKLKGRMKWEKCLSLPMTELTVI